MVWLVAFLGIIASFIVKFINRRDKTKEPDIVYWIKDNYYECAVSFIFMVILMIIGSKTEFDEEAILSNIPFVKALPFDLLFAAVAGYFNNVLWYAVIKKFKGK